jgi:hypothetical protein
MCLAFGSLGHIFFRSEKQSLHRLGIQYTIFDMSKKKHVYFRRKLMLFYIDCGGSSSSFRAKPSSYSNNVKVKFSATYLVSWTLFWDMWRIGFFCDESTCLWRNIFPTNYPLTPEFQYTFCILCSYLFL